MQLYEMVTNSDYKNFTQSEHKISTLIVSIVMINSMIIKHPELSGCITTLIVRNTPWGQLSINLWQGLWPNRGASSQSQAVVQPWTTGADGNINVSTPKLSLDCIT